MSSLSLPPFLYGLMKKNDGNFKIHHKIFQCFNNFGLMIYVFYAFNQGSKIKLIKQYQDNKENYTTEKIMTNPRIKFQHNEGEIYDITAKKAFHKDEQEITLFDVFATGEIGNITAGALEVSEDGTHLIFTKNPVLILKEVKKK